MGNRDSVMNLAINVIGSQDAAELWMKTPQVALNNKKPIDCLRNEDDIDDLYNVINLLNAMENGVYL